MVCIARESTRWDEAEADRLTRAFAGHHWVRLPQLLDPDLLESVLGRVAAATFRPRHHVNVDPPSVDLCMVPDAGSALLELVMNDPRLLELVRRVSDRPDITRFTGFVYRLTPAPGHEHHWHDDDTGDRAVALSLALSSAFTGGLLHIREKSSGRVIAEVANAVPGDAVLFRVSPHLQHRALPVHTGQKTAFAGWFCTGGTYADRLRAAAGSERP
jgi:hypothetical protein